MARLLKIRGGEAEISVELDDSTTADALWEALPIESRASPTRAKRSRSVASRTGRRASHDDNPRAASPVTVVGKVVGGIEDGRRVSSGERLRVEAAGER